MAVEKQSGGILVGGRWQIKLPIGWDHRLAGSTVALFRAEDGVGAINVSTFRRAPHRPIDPLQIVNDFAGGLGLVAIVPPTISVAPPGALAAAEGGYKKKDSNWIVYAAVGTGTALVASYNCRSEFQSIEIVDVKTILSSITLGRSGEVDSTGAENDRGT